MSETGIAFNSYDAKAGVEHLCMNRKGEWRRLLFGSNPLAAVIRAASRRPQRRQKSSRETGPMSRPRIRFRAIICNAYICGFPSSFCEPEVESLLKPPQTPITTAESVDRGVSRPAGEIRVYTLGRFSLVSHGRPVAFTGKSPRKPLELLQALIALGGRDVHLSILMDAVWLDESSANRRKLVDNTIHRLRKILGDDQAIEVGNSKLTLSAQRCWVDAWVFDRMASELLVDSRAIDHKAKAIVDLYRGHFLDREPALPWLIRYRDRLQSRYQRLVLAYGSGLEAAGEWAAAIETYQRALEVDNLAESFYRRLMACHLQSGEHAESLRVYRRCRDLLSIVFGVKPSPETEVLRCLAQKAS